MRIILVGFMGVGKTFLGKKLASILNLEFVDLDYFIESKHKATIPFIFNLIGEQGFRTIEQRSLHEILKKDNIVLSTGGGTPCFFNNMELLNQNGFTVYLYLSPDKLLNRLSQSKKKRPLIDKLEEDKLLKFINKRLQEREKYYQQAKIKINVINISANKLKDIIIEKSGFFE